MSKKRVIDLHGLTVSQAREVLDKEVDTCILKNIWCLEIIHGLGTGKLRSMVESYLSSSKYVVRFSLDLVNPGVTKAYFY